MVHALDSDMMEYVMNDPEKANAFIIANEGYDVWLGNNRGNNYSLGHTTLSTKDKAYWDYWQADLGLKDVPTWIDFILEKTSLETLSYVGHSQGTTQMFLGASLDPEYFKSKINVYIALAPVASTAHIEGFLKFVAHDIDEMVATLVDEKGLYSWFPQMSEGSIAMDAFCDLAKNFCEKFVDKFVDETVDNVPRFEMAIPSTPSG